MADVKAYGGEIFPYPVVCDDSRELAVRLGMLDPSDQNAQGLPMAVRAVFIIGPDKLLKLSILCKWELQPLPLSEREIGTRRNVFRKE